MTPTEASALCCFYCLIVGVFIYKEIKIKDICKIVYGGVKSAAGIMLIVAATQAFGWVITRAGIPQKMAQTFTSSITNPLVFVFAVCVILLVAGCFIDAVPALLIFAPIFCPTADAYGINMIYFGVVMVIVLCIGPATPPVGINLYVASSVGGQPVHKIIPPSAHSSAGHFCRHGDRDPGTRDHHVPSQRAVMWRTNGIRAI